MNSIKIKLILLFIFFVLSSNTFAQNRKEFFKSQIALGELTDPQLKEVSGIVPATGSRNFWVHNDSGDGANVYLIDHQANLVEKFTLEGIEAIDCEDIDRVKIGHKMFLVLADIGNNLANRSWLSLYVFPEPVLGDSSLIPKSSIKTLLIKFPQHKRLDAESIMIDPLDNMLYVISKREFQSTIYRAAVFANMNKNYFTLEEVVKLPFTFVTAGSIDATGTAMLIRNITNIYYWRRTVGEPWSSALRKKPFQINYIVEPQGEAITFDNRGTGFYTISERPFGLKSYLYYFEKIDITDK